MEPYDEDSTIKALNQIEKELDEHDDIAYADDEDFDNDLIFKEEAKSMRRPLTDRDLKRLIEWRKENKRA